MMMPAASRLGFSEPNIMIKSAAEFEEYVLKGVQEEKIVAPKPEVVHTPDHTPKSRQRRKRVKD